jgi:hypothetical protein
MTAELIKAMAAEAEAARAYEATRAVVRRPEQALSFVLPGIVGEQVLTLRHQTIVDEP